MAGIFAVLLQTQANRLEKPYLTDTGNTFGGIIPTKLKQTVGNSSAS
jgi:hypothetical protein